MISGISDDDRRCIQQAEKLFEKYRTNGNIETSIKMGLLNLSKGASESYIAILQEEIK
jgi:hypothetical protein